MIKTIKFNKNIYPAFQAEGFAAQFAIPFAKQVCKGVGVDVGCNRKEWCLPGAIPVDPLVNGWTALNFPAKNLDYIFSSHCLEHLDDWILALDYWYIKLKKGGVLFLYLPDYSQEYWRPWNNRKHKHVLNRFIIKDFLTEQGYKTIFVSEVDLNNSYMIMAEK